MSLVEQIKNLQYPDSSMEETEKLQAALDKYHQMVEDGILIPRKNNLQNGYSGHINGHNLKWSNI